MNTKYSRRKAMLLLLFLGCFTAAGSGQAQETNQVGPIRLDGPPASRQNRTGPIYLLSLVQVVDAKPAESVWLLQKEIVQPDQPVEVQETAYKSLNAASLRDFLSRLPKGANIVCTSSDIPGSSPAISISSGPSFSDFTAFCRSKGIQLEFGIPF